MRRHSWLVFTALALLVACRATPFPSPTATEPPSPTPTVSPPSPSPTPTASPTRELSPQESPSPIPTTGPFNSPVTTPVPATTDESWVDPPPRPLPLTAVNTEAPRRVPNAQRTFWIVEGTTGERREIAARLRIQTPHAAMWVEQGTWHDIRQLEQAATYFETVTYPRMRDVFGSEWTPGIDNDPRINILHATGLGDDVLGYVSSLDEYPSDVYPRSNESEMITVNVDVVDIGSTNYNGLLARELQHLIQWHQDRNEERWVKEGLGELAATLVGSRSERLHQAYLEQVDTSLVGRTDDASHRGAILLFMTYFHQRFGDDGVRTLTAEPANGIPGFEAALEALGTGLAFDDLFSDWLAANHLDSVLESREARFGYPELDLAQPTTAAVYDTYPVSVDAVVHQLGADYIILRGDEDVRIEFTGQQEAPLLPGIAPVGQPVWWSNRADESLTVLTGAFDLREVEQATLTYRVWYDIEPHYDYATVEISVDDGQHWRMLRTPSGTGADPHGTNPGWAYTGESGGWIREEIDLSGYAGGEILIRFSYLTDAAISGVGLLLHHVYIPEINLETETEAETSRWRSQGFVLTDGLVPQDYVALLISHGEDVTVERLALTEGQSAEWIAPLGSQDLREAVLVLSAIAPLTQQPAPYQLVIDH